MDTKVIPEGELENKKISVPDGGVLFYIKLVGIGRETLGKHANQANKVVEGASGFYIVAEAAEIEGYLVSQLSRAVQLFKEGQSGKA